MRVRPYYANHVLRGGDSSTPTQPLRYRPDHLYRAPRLVRRPKAVVLGLVALLGLGLAPLTVPATAVDAPAFSASKTVTRNNLDDGVDHVVDSRNFTTSVSEIADLRDRQTVTVNWSGAHPTGGLVTDHNSAAAAQMEYPVVIMQCRGVDSATAPAGKQVSPQTCWTQTPSERFAYSDTGFIYPSYRMDRYAATADRAAVVNQPVPLPSDCSPVAIPHWVPFIGANGTVYPGGLMGCGGLAPEAANAAASLQPGNTTYGVTDSTGHGSAKFVMQTTETNASVGCSSTVTCTLEIIPIMGISCDPAGTAPGTGLGMLPQQRPPSAAVPTVAANCEVDGHFPPGAPNGGGELPNVPVTGALWWSASNWANRISVPLTFAPSSSVCDVVNNQAQVLVYGSEAMAQATEQWAPAFCTNPKLFTLRHVQTSEPQAKNLLSIKNIEGAIQAGPPSTPFAAPVVQAPAAVSGWGIAFSVDAGNGDPYPDLKLNARLIAKLMSESYQGCASCLQFGQISHNPIDVSRDPEFQALNPGIPATNYLAAGAALSFMSSDSDVMTALTSYINSDPEARAWLDGTPDPWGMVVNPAYRGIALPVANWPLLDTHFALSTTSNQCLLNNPVAWLPLVASPLSNPALIALNLQFDVANSQVVCQNNGAQNQKLVGLGREAAGSRLLFGLVSLADAVRYQLPVASLQTRITNPNDSVFTNADGRTFVGPTEAALRNAAKLLIPDDDLGTWPIPYDTLRTTSKGAAAYPGTLLISIDVPTAGLPKADAARFGQLLHYAAGAGQKQGLQIGQLPPGYLPLTSGNGLGALVAYTNKAAAAVVAQAGIVPFVSGKPNPVVTPPSNPGSSAPIDVPPSTAPGVVPPSTDTTTPPTKTTTSPAPTKSTINAAPVGRTTSISAGPLGNAFPIAAVAALVLLCALAWRTGVGRR